jgi:hypothetical protein
MTVYLTGVWLDALDVFVFPPVLTAKPNPLLRDRL